MSMRTLFLLFVAGIFAVNSLGDIHYASKGEHQHTFKPGECAAEAVLYALLAFSTAIIAVT